MTKSDQFCFTQRALFSPSGLQMSQFSLSLIWITAEAPTWSPYCNPVLISKLIVMSCSCFKSFIFPHSFQVVKDSSWLTKTPVIWPPTLIFQAYFWHCSCMSSSYTSYTWQLAVPCIQHTNNEPPPSTCCSLSLETPIPCLENSS